MTTWSTTSEQAAAAETVTAEPVSPTVDLVVPSIDEIGVDISAESGDFPADRSANRAVEPSEDLATTLSVGSRLWSVTARCWTPAATRHRPLYFEEANVERYGYAHAPCLQPAVSAAHFFGNAVALPYRMAAEPPCECVYTLGHYRPGDCAPYRLHGLPTSCQGVSWQAAMVIGLIALVP